MVGMRGDVRSVRAAFLKARCLSFLQVVCLRVPEEKPEGEEERKGNKRVEERTELSKFSTSYC